MQFTPTALQGVFLLDLDALADPRGLFARTWCQQEFAAHGLPGLPVQTSLSLSTRRGTLRGLHFQRPPSQEGKLVRCVRGALLDVLVDLRPLSGAFLRAVTVELTADNRRAVWVPPGVAHGFQTLMDDTEVHYQMTDEHQPALSEGIRWDDPALDIPWPLLPPSILSSRDRCYPDLEAAHFNFFKGY